VHGACPAGASREEEAMSLRIVTVSFKARIFQNRWQERDIQTFSWRLPSGGRDLLRGFRGRHLRTAQRSARTGTAAPQRSNASRRCQSHQVFAPVW
jgi:hypothetical protein